MRSKFPRALQSIGRVWALIWGGDLGLSVRGGPEGMDLGSYYLTVNQTTNWMGFRNGVALT